MCLLKNNARVAELVDALDLESSIARCGGSTPSTRTNNITGCGSIGRAMRLGRIGWRFKSSHLDIEGMIHITSIVNKTIDMDHVLHNLNFISSMGEQTVDNRQTLDRNQYEVPKITLDFNYKYSIIRI